MAIRDLCGFDTMVTADLDERFSAIASVPTIVAAAGRGGSACLRIGSVFANLVKLGLSAHATYGAAFAFKCAGPFTAGSPPLFTFGDGLANPIDQVSLCVTAAGNLIVKRGTGSGTTLGTSAASALVAGVQHHIQIMVTINDTTGSYEVKVDGATVLSGSGVDTKQTTNAWVDSYTLNGLGSFNTDFDDLYVWDGSGSANTGFPGDVRVLSALPSGAGATTGMTPSTGANYAAVDDATPNTSDYVSGDTVSEKDTYAFADIVGTGTVRGALLSAYATKAAEGAARGIKGVCRSGGTEQLSSEVTLGVGWRYWLQAVYENDPATAAAWASVAALNSAEWGVSVAT